MNQINHIAALAKVDLNLLVVFAALDHHRSVTKTASALGVSQSAVSHALSRMRAVFGDDLFVKTPRGMVPTPVAEHIGPQIRPLVSSLKDVLFGREAFSPETLQRTFRIRTTDLIEHLLLPHLLTLQQKEASGLQASFRPVDFALPAEELQDGTTDLAIAGFFGDLPDGFYKQKILTDDFRCTVRKGHPLVGKKMDLTTYCELPHILIAPGGELSGQVDKILKKQKKNRFIAAGSSGFLAAGWAVAQSDAVLTAPSRLLSTFESFLPVRTYPLPVQLPQVTIVQVWHERQHRDPAHKWFREKIKSAF